LFPRYACFVAKPEEAGRAFVASVNQLTRNLDDDPYTDCFWGILTGYDAAAALRVARCSEPLIVSKVASGTEVALDRCAEGLWYDELVKNRFVKKEKGGQAMELKGPDDTTSELVKALNAYQPDLFITSGHATEHDWQIGFRYRNGSFRCANGRLYGLDTQGKQFPVESPNPKVYLPVGNCLMGHVDGKDAMALAWMNSGGVNQMIGYTVTTWYGYAGWGCLDYFVEQPGRYTFSESFFANSQALIHRLQLCSPGAEKVQTDASGRPKTTPALSDWARAEKLTAQDVMGLIYDRDTLAFYGDPAWVARMAKGPLAWDQTLVEKDGTWTFTIKPKKGETSFEPVNRNGSQRGYRPIIEFLPRRVKNVRLLEGSDLHPVITDNFVLVPNPKVCNPVKEYKVVFRAEIR
jgi:zinc protease